MIQNVLKQIGGIENYGLISIGLFFVAFLGMLLWTCRLKKPFLKSMASLPLDRDAEPAEENETTYE